MPPSLTDGGFHLKNRFSNIEKKHEGLKVGFSPVSIFEVVKGKKSDKGTFFDDRENLEAISRVG